MILMAKKSSTNAVKKLDEQIKSVDYVTIKNTETLNNAKRVRKNDSSTKNAVKSETKPVSYSSKSVSDAKSVKKTDREKVVVAPKKTTTKKSSTVKSTTPAKREKVKVVKEKGSTTQKKSTSKKTTKIVDNTKAKEKELKRVVENEKKKEQQVEDENLEIFEFVGSNNETISLEAKDEERVKNVSEVIKDKEKQEDSKTLFELKEEILYPKKDNNDEDFEIFDFVGSNNKTISLEKTKDERVNNVKSVIEDKEKQENRKTIFEINKNEKLKRKDNDDLRLDKPIDLDHIEKYEEYKILDEFKNDIDNGKKSKIVQTQKNGKHFIHVKPKKTYTTLEKDLRSLYEKANDVIDEPSDNLEVEIFDDVEVEKEGRKRFSILDHISQKVLNFFMIFLFIIFLLMLIGFIAFVIYVSTF